MNANTGAVLWTVRFNGGSIFASATVVNGIIYIGGANGVFFAQKADVPSLTKPQRPT